MPRVALACQGSFGRAGFSCLALVVGAESTCLAGSASLAGLRGLAGSSDPAKRVPVLRGGASPIIFEEDSGSVACPGSIPLTPGLSDIQLDTLTGLLRQAPISEVHRTLMGIEVESISSAKSGLNEAFTSLLRGFEVRKVICIFLTVPHTQGVLCIDSIP